MIDLLLNKKSVSDELYESAQSAFQKVFDKIKIMTEHGPEEIVLKSDTWHTIVPGDPSSPKIMGLTNNKSLIYYPKYSTPYQHRFIGKCKFATILSGCIYDEISGKKFSTERMDDGNPHCVKIRPEDDFKPYTKNCECYVLVQVDDCNKFLDQVCP